MGQEPHRGLGRGLKGGEVKTGLEVHEEPGDGSEECAKHADRSQKAGRSRRWKFLLEQSQGD